MFTGLDTATFHILTGQSETLPEVADITILPRVMTLAGTYGRVYYFQGNIFKPLDLHGREVGRVRGAIKRFLKEYEQQIVADRNRLTYRTLPELYDLQMEWLTCT